jgi:hypothetical protein
LGNQETEAGLPNIFNQYSVDENRVTNALLQTLASSPSLSRSFLKEFLSLRVRTRRAALLFLLKKGQRPKGTELIQHAQKKKRMASLARRSSMGFPSEVYPKHPIGCRFLE